MIYYIDPIHGDPLADGSTPEKARLTYTELDLRPGDTVLFRRGSFIRDSLYRKPGADGAYITYGAYGEGENPIFCGSIDVSDPEKWREVHDNVWQYTDKLPSEVCNFIYDNGRIGATLRWEENLLSAQGDWYDSSMGGTEGRRDSKEQKVFIYSEGNPGKVYSHIECAVWGRRNMSDNVNYTACENLSFYGSGVHALTGGAHHITVRHCSFCFIGGAVWNRQLKIRFGNAIEFWNTGEDILIEECYFNNIYDSCITHQGSAECLPAKNLIMRRNLFINYGMGAYEGRDRMSIDSAFDDNICVNAGGGFSGFGDTKPRNSEIYPQPMGHHLFMWRIPEATEGGSLEIARNLFYNATGGAMYSIIGEAAEAQMHLSCNRYYTENKGLLTHIGGESYRPDEFDRYLEKYGEPGAVYGEHDIMAEIEKWFEMTGCGRCGVPVFTDKLPGQKYFVGSTLVDPLSYDPDEEIVFRLTLVEEGHKIGCPKFRYIRRGDDGFFEEGMVDGTSGEFEYQTSTDRPGYIHLTVTPCDEAGVPLRGYDVFEGGACAGFNEIRQAVQAPADFDEFWSRVISEELDPIPPVVIEKKEFHCGDPGDIVYDLKIACPGKYPVSGYLRMPRNAAEKSLPLIVGYMGYGVSSANIPTKSEAIQFFINQHGIVNGQPAEYYASLVEGEFAGFGFKEEENKSPDTVYFKWMIFRALQAIRYCKTMPEWNGRDITVTGGSMGAFQAVSAAAHDSDVTALVVYIPWMCDLRGIEVGRLEGWRPAASVGLDYYDTVSEASRVHCPVYIYAGLGDYICPPSGVTALYHAVSGKRHLSMMQNRTHSYMPPEFVSYDRDN